MLVPGPSNMLSGGFAYTQQALRVPPLNLRPLLYK